MKIKEYLYLFTILILASLLVLEKCSPGETAPVEVIRTDTIHVPPDTIIRSVVNEKYIDLIRRDTIIQINDITTIDTIMVHDTIHIDGWTANIYQDSIQEDSMKLNWQIITKGELIGFFPELYYLGSTHIDSIKERHFYHKYKTRFLIEPLAGFQYGEGKVYPAIGLRLGYKNYTGSIITSSPGPMFLFGTRLRF